MDISLSTLLIPAIVIGLTQVAKLWKRIPLKTKSGIRILVAGLLVALNTGNLLINGESIDQETVKVLLADSSVQYLIAYFGYQSVIK